MPIHMVRMLVTKSARGEPPDCVRRGITHLAREFPTVALRLEPDAPAEPPTVRLDLWRDRRNGFREFDAAVEEIGKRGPLSLVVRGPWDEVVQGIEEMLTRWQRLLDRRNEASQTRGFEGVLRALKTLHDPSKPLVLADWHHALDTWQWTLRLEPSAGAAVQMAALLHDIERLESEADARVEHLSHRYDAFKDAHARRGADIARGLLHACGVELPTVSRAAALIESHERSGEDRERALLNDADALSFFSQNSDGYLDYFGAAQTARKIAFTLKRMRPAARARLESIRIRADVADLLTRERGRAHP